MTTHSHFSARAASGLLGSLMLASGSAQGVDFCVGSSVELEAALVTSITNGAISDTIKVRIGSYTSPAGGFGAAGAFSSGDSITIEGGWVSTELVPCATQSTDPSTTIIDGEGTRPAMILRHSTGGGTITVRNLTFRNGLRNVSMTGDDRGGGLYVTGFAGYVGDILVERNIFRGNVASFLGGGLHAGSDGGTVTVRNNLFVGNTANQGAAMYVFGNNGASFVVNNTATANVSPQSGVTVATLSTGGSNTVTLTNNILWANTSGTQTDVFGPQLLLLSNDIQRITQTPLAGSSGNVSVDPEFVGPGDFRLVPTSPLIDVGIQTPLGGLPALDLAGLARVQGDTVDIGAYEFDGVFEDGFE